MEGMNQTKEHCIHYGNVTVKFHVKLLLTNKNVINFFNEKNDHQYRKQISWQK
jgi:hypothetical protein